MSMNCHMNESSVHFQISTLEVWNSDEVVQESENMVTGSSFAWTVPLKTIPRSLSLSGSFLFS